MKEIAVKVQAMPKKGKRPRMVVFTQGSTSTVVVDENVPPSKRLFQSSVERSRAFQNLPTFQSSPLLAVHVEPSSLIQQKRADPPPKKKSQTRNPERESAGPGGRRCLPDLHHAGVAFRPRAGTNRAWWLRAQ